MLNRISIVTTFPDSKHLNPPHQKCSAGRQERPCRPNGRALFLTQRHAGEHAQVRISAAREPGAAGVGRQFLLELQTPQHPVHPRMVEIHDHAAACDDPSEVIASADVRDFVGEHGMNFRVRPHAPVGGKQYHGPPPANGRRGLELSGLADSDRRANVQLHSQILKQRLDRPIRHL
jgi:hypothetical protein